MLRPSRIVATLLGALLVSTLASAEPNAVEKETARQLMLDGRRLREAGQLEAASAAFARAHAIMGLPTTGLQLASVLERLGKLVEARAVTRELLSQPASPTESAAFRESREVAQALDQELARRIPSLTLELEGVEGDRPLEVALDGQPLSPAMQGAPLRLNPGPHHLEVSESGRSLVSVDPSLAETENRVLRLHLPASTNPAASAESARDASSSTSPNWLTLTGLGVAGTGLLVGTVTGTWALLEGRALTQRCPNSSCPTGQYDHLDGARQHAVIANVSFVVAGAGLLLAGIGHWALAPALKEHP